MTIETQSQLLSPKDRNENRVQKVQDLLNKKQAPDTFDAYVFVDPETESMAGAIKAGAEFYVNGGRAFCRVYNEDFFDASRTSPLDAKTKAEFKHSINGCPQGSIRFDHPDISAVTNGSTWVCRKNGAMIDLISLKSADGFSFNEATAGVGRNSFNSGKKMPLGGRMGSATIEVKFADDANMRSQLAQFPHYKTFLDEFTKRLSQTAFSQPSVMVNSMFRSATDQARAMARTRYYGTPATYNSFLAWFKSEYGGEGRDSKPVLKVIESNKTSSASEMETAIANELKKQVAKGRYLSKHMRNGAFDFQTRKSAMSDVQLMLDVLKEMKNSFVTFYNWEGVWSYNTGNENDSREVRKAAGLAKRRQDGAISNEHIHLNLKTTGSGGE